MKSKPNAKGNPEDTDRPLRVRKSVPRKLITRGSVLKMLAVMEKTPDKSVDLVQDFLTTGRTGRRNAMPDILGEHAATSVGDLPDCLEKLNTQEASTSGASTSGASTSGASTSGAPANPFRSPPGPQSPTGAKPCQPSAAEPKS